MTETPAEHLIQSHFVRVGRQGNGERKKRRDWSLFLFFRVMDRQEATASLDRMLGEPEKPSLNEQQFNIELVNPSLWTPFVSDPEAAATFIERTDPVALFLHWLKAVTGEGPAEMITDLGSLMTRYSAAAANQAASKAAISAQQSNQHLGQASHKALADFSNIEALARDGASDHGLKVLQEGLARVCAYELIREITRAAQNVAVARSSEAEANLADVAGDRSPIEIAFTYSGLGAVGVSERVLKSFPDAFKEGMAARASRLGDVGKSAPSQWDGELGQSAIHGMLSGGFAVEGAKEEDWERLRRQIRLFNEAGEGEGAELRKEVGFIFRAIGLEILHIELGQDPYEVAPDGTVISLPHRLEHFGFRDGISQPTMDLPGSGTPAANGSWNPVAPGEIFLGLKDEDGCVQPVPSHSALQKGGTYIVFRKLQQDVAGFRAFLASARPGSKLQQDRLAAQFVGRWQNGVSIIRAPNEQPDLNEDQEHDLNNFRYVEEDPSGRHCPLGAHVRRANPRDIGGKAQARRHRLLRRGMAYGGALLPDGAPDDGQERGLLFVAANARIDVQFELVQSRWLNGGEFLGQAGLNKCPITGPNTGSPGDQFITADSATPVNRIPRFVQTRGGDYFYAPGIDGLKAIAEGKITEPNSWVPNEDGHNSAKTEDVFSAENIRRLMAITLTTGRPHQEAFKSVTSPDNYVEDETTGRPIVFVGKHDQVKKVLSGQLGSVGVRHYFDASERMTPGARLLISTETGDADLREPMKAVMKRAWEVLSPYNAINAVLDDAISRAIGRTRKVGRIDLVHDLAAEPVYDLVANVYGVPGPNHLTELAISLPFGRRHVSELHPDWLATLSGKGPQNPRLATLQVWSILMFSDLIGNFRNQEELKVLAMDAASQFGSYLNELLRKERAKPKKKPEDVRTLVEAFCAIEGEEFAGVTLSTTDYYRIVQSLLLELVPSALAVIPATFGSLINAMLGQRVNLSYLIPHLDKLPSGDGVKRLIYEMNRLSPSLPLLQRYAKEEVVLGEGMKIEKGNWIGALVVAANLDKDVFPEPRVFSLGAPYGPKRDLDDYIMFGSVGSDRECFGRDRLAMLALAKFLRAAAKFPGLRRVAGVGGVPVPIIRTMIGLPAKFARF